MVWKIKHLILLFISFFIISCQTEETDNLKLTKEPFINTEIVTIDDNFKPIMGEIIYVPAYSYIYYSNRQRSHSLAITLSLHNTDVEFPIMIKSVKYYDSKGQLLEDYLSHPIQLNALSSTNFYIEDDDTRGGVGGNFLIEWVAQKEVSSPIAESVMVSTASTQGISFVSTGRIIKKLKFDDVK
ncbi:DUF3124 domain-containing protein [Cyanobacterium aponinum FACHB-4101]|uniref:DUF3124 domain-containing protein n=1 Tax=Cyanobacterium aponinum TaxID=379064 RepID=UPI000C12D9A7|nr:DUF3124 domain-containing protein [Cyanobacterium aponinum]MBD2394292.1 DUF3124 domain-containing protein [Cyanobacterium aponinum FACHB-4101]PHV63173.1 hypothetical protein CSQ80_06470 [Cyanobacterium aponinum IPPAS B-1201]